MECRILESRRRLFCDRPTRLFVGGIRASPGIYHRRHRSGGQVAWAPPSKRSWTPR